MLRVNGSEVCFVYCKSFSIALRFSNAAEKPTCGVVVAVDELVDDVVKSLR